MYVFLSASSIIYVIDSKILDHFLTYFNLANKHDFNQQA